MNKCNCNKNQKLIPLNRKNYKEDFYVRIQLIKDNEPVSFPNGDFTITFTSSGGGSYVCGRTNGVLNNCKIVDGIAVCFIIGGTLKVGLVKAEVKLIQEDINFPDSKRRDILFPCGVIDIIEGPSSFDDAQLEVALNYAIITAYDMAVKKGYSGTQEEFYNTFSNLTKTLNDTKLAYKDLKTKYDDIVDSWGTLKISITNKLNTIMDGKSAYELAKEQGYTGTVQQWLASLKGERGERGLQGIQGQKGDTGAKGDRGLKGDKGDIGWLGLVNHGTADTTFTLTPNAMHVWGEVSQLSLTLGTPIPNVVNEYVFEFQSPATPTNLSLPATLHWYKNYIPPIRAGKLYRVWIISNFIFMWEVS